MYLSLNHIRIVVGEKVYVVISLNDSVDEMPK